MSREPSEHLSADQLRKQLINVSNDLYFLIDMFGLTEKQADELRRNLRQHYDLHVMLAQRTVQQGRKMQ